MKYTKPYAVKNGYIVDANDNEVRLWGTNYYVPFNNNYVNLEEMGIDHCKAIDRDIEDFKRMGIEIIRMHAYEREITDIHGNIVENDHLRVMDYLTERLYEEGIYVMMTPIVWYNTVVNQQCITKNYAFWSAEKSEASGYANFYPNHAMVWHPEAMKCQENYLRQFFTRKNVFSGKTLPEYENIIALESSNETIYPTPELIRGLEKEKESAKNNPFRQEECRIVDMYSDYLAQNRLEDTDGNCQIFCARLVENYLKRYFGIADEYFSGVLKSHIFYQFEKPSIYACLENAPVDCISVTAYAAENFDTSYNDHMNYFKAIRKLREDYAGLSPMRKGLIAYEFDAPTTLLGHPYAAFGKALASIGVQIAIQFTYTPLDVAPYNPGWIVHYMNLRHTPEKAAAFIAGNMIFHNTMRNEAIPEDDEVWKGEDYLIRAKDSMVICHDGETLIHSKSILSEEVNRNTPKRIVGIGSNRFVGHEGSGIYRLSLVSEDTLSLEVLPDQWYVNDPYRGKSFRFMANRYVDTNREWIVSRLRESGTAFTVDYPGFDNIKVFFLKDNTRKEIPVNGHTFVADPGEYLIERV